MKIYITVIGSSVIPNKRVYDLAYRIGYEIGRRKAILVCGGRGGVMEAAAKGAKEAGGTTVGILPGFDRSEANPYIDIAIPTGMSHARNAINVLAGDSIIVVHGGPGTLSEVGLALAYGKPVIALRTSGGVASLLADRLIGSFKVHGVDSPQEAVEKAILLSKARERL